MTEEVERCPLCDSTKSELFDRRVVQASLVTNRLCQSCGLVYQSPRMSSTELEIFYQREYRELYQGSEGPSVKDLEVQRGRASNLLDFVGERLKPGARHLDIGSSAGLLLHGMQNRYGTASVGVEPGTAYRRYSQSQGLQIYESLEALLKSGEPPFHLVSIAHVLEHVLDPVDYLCKLRESFLSEDGLLLVEVPNIYSHDSFEVAHMFAFSSHTLKQVLVKAGYEIIALRKHGKPRSELLPLYITVLARPFVGVATKRAGAPRPEAGVVLKRRMGLLHRRVLQKLFPQKAWLPVPEPSAD